MIAFQKQPILLLNGEVLHDDQQSRASRSLAKIRKSITKRLIYSSSLNLGPNILEIDFKISKNLAPNIACAIPIFTRFE